MSLRSRREKSAIYQINITPLVDVMLVILIIFMVLAPTIQHGVVVDMPKASFEPIKSTEIQMVVTVTESGDIYINKLKTDLAKLELKLSKIFAKNPDRQVFFKADKKVPYGYVVKAMAAIKKAGITKLGMITEPDE